MILLLLNQVVLLAPALVTLSAIGYLAIRHQRLFLALFMMVTALESTRDFAPNIATQFSGFTVFPEDIVIIVGGAAVLLRIGQWQLSSATRSAALVLAALIGSGVVTWVSTYGVQIGINSWRPQMLYAVLFLYAATRPRAWSWDDVRVIVVGASILVALASLAGILLYGLGSATSSIEVSGVVEGGRPVSSSGALLILVGLWATVLSPGRWNTKRLLVVLLLASMTLLTQHRSVWVAALLGVVVWWLAPRIHRRATSRGLGGFTRTVLILVGGTATALVGLSTATLEQSARSDETLLWRIARWIDSMTIPRSGLEWLLGSALGPTPASTPTLFPTSAHSLYVNTIEMTGLIGLVATLFLITAVGRTHAPLSTGPLGLIICFTFLGFGMTYQLPPWAWMVAGILLAAGRTRLTDGLDADLAAGHTADRQRHHVEGERDERGTDHGEDVQVGAGSGS